MAAALNSRTAVLAAVAAALVGATLYDQIVGFGDRPEPDERPARKAPALQVDSPVKAGRGSIAREIAELEHFRAAAPAVRARYQAIAVPYAEAVATFATLYAAGEPPAAVARQRVAALLPPGVRVDTMLVSEPGAADAAATWLTAQLNISSGDSEAFAAALVRLGDAANGMAWKELTVVSDPERRFLRASGQLALLMIRQAE